MSRPSEILLVHPRERARTFGGMPPLGLGWIASFIESKGHKIEMVDLQISENTFEEALRNSKPKIVGIAGTSHTRYESFKLAGEAKKFDKNIFVVYGGAHATFTAEDTLRNVPAIDLVVKGEGEVTFLETVERVLRNNYDFLEIDGICYRHNGKIIHNKPRSRIPKLDVLPFPKRSVEDAKKYNLKMNYLNIPGASVVSTRGCPINCSFCSASAMFGKKVTFRTAKNVVDEIEDLLKNYGAQGIKFFDSTLTLRKNHVESLCGEIRRRRLKFPWECEIRVNTVDKDLLKTMRDAGCYYVDFGVESASSRVLKTMHKVTTVEEAENVLKWTREIGLRTKVFFTFGHIGETMADAKITMEFIEKWEDHITLPAVIVGIRIYPGTPVERYAFETGALGENFSWAAPYQNRRVPFLGIEPEIPVLIQPKMGYPELKQIRYAFVKKKLKNPRVILQTLKNAWEKDNIKKVWIVGKGMFRMGLRRAFNSGGKE